MTLENFLIKNKACSSGFEYAKDMNLAEFYNNCNCGDWIIWLFSKTNPNDSKAVVLAAAHCANACRDLLEDERSLRAIDAAMNFALNYQAYLPEQLYEIYYAARAAARADAAIWAVDARAAAVYAVDAARSVAYAIAYADNAARAAARADAALAAYAAYANAFRDNKLIADIVRKHLPLEIWNQEIINN